jgi:hypothetical protein
MLCSQVGTKKFCDGILALRAVVGIVLFLQIAPIDGSGSATPPEVSRDCVPQSWMTNYTVVSIQAGEIYRLPIDYSRPHQFGEITSGTANVTRRF